MKTTKKKNNRRYKIHYKLRKKGYKINTGNKTVFINTIEFQIKSYPAIVAKYLQELSAMGYAIQSTLD